MIIGNFINGQLMKLKLFGKKFGHFVEFKVKQTMKI